MIAIFLGAITLLALPFNGIFDGALLLLGTSGLALGLVTREEGLDSIVVSRIVLLFGLVFLLGLGLDIYQYYAVEQQSGGYYPWILMAPFTGAILFLVFQFRRWLPG